MAEQFPRINGYEYSFSDVEITVDGQRYTGIRSLSYNPTRDVGMAEGSPAQPLGYGRGTYGGGEGSFSMLRVSFDAMVEAVGEGYMEKIFPIVASYAPEGSPITTDELIGCTMTGIDFQGERGPDPLYVEVSFKFLNMLTNGVAPLRGMLV